MKSAVDRPERHKFFFKETHEGAQEAIIGFLRRHGRHIERASFVVEELESGNFRGTVRYLSISGQILS